MAPLGTEIRSWPSREVGQRARLGLRNSTGTDGGHLCYEARALDHFPRVHMALPGATLHPLCVRRTLCLSARGSQPVGTCWCLLCLGAPTLRPTLQLPWGCYITLVSRRSLELRF